MVRRSVADHRLGRLSARLPCHHLQAQGAAHLRCELVLSRLHRDDRGAASRQQPGAARFGVRFEVLRRLGRHPGRHVPVVVRPQRGRLLPDRRLPRHHVLLHPEACRAADLFLPALYHPLLGADLSLHLGRSPPSALHGAAGLDADARHDLLDHAVDALLGRHDQRPDDAVGCLGQAAHRSRAAHARGLRRLLRHVDLRRPDDVDQGGQFAQPLHRLDHRPRAFRRARLGRLRLLRRAVLPGAVGLESQGPLQPQARQLALLGRHPRHRSLHLGDVGVRHPARR
ncbi:hypothetical protein ABH999_004632 [Bradyrhizobium yuanmingense]